MEKDIKDYLHLYIGCMGRLFEGDKAFGVPAPLDANQLAQLELPYAKKSGFSIKPILRPLSDMTKEESKWMLKNYTWQRATMQMNEQQFAIELCERVAGNSSVFIWMLKHGFDLFGLIEAGLAIDKTKI